ncbi:TetR/AcrR family transcriptional regulator [Streptomyces sp. cg28]|uniref:TetR/AcrR family transcriptional regulator n=1 Tax=Streptomyces sp. cg28 TaxID=3403457 RepID=UPI003B219E45
MSALEPPPHPSSGNDASGDASPGEDASDARTGRPAGTARAGRSDARRNREKLLAAARSLFGAAAEGPVTLDAVARAAGVGIGTLYRHFPTREALVEAVYAAELDGLAAAAPELLGDLPPVPALRAWLDRYTAFAATKHGMIDMLRSGPVPTSVPTRPTRERITAAVGELLAAGAGSGSLRADVDPDDVTTLLLGVSLAAASGSSPEQTGRALDLIVDALRPRTG